MTSYKEIKTRFNQIYDSGNLKKKGMLLYGISRKDNLLDFIPYDLFNLNENLNFDLTQEFFTIKEVGLVSDNVKNFFVFRGMNFSTSFEYDKSNKVFKERKYDKKYMRYCRMSQNLSRVMSHKLEFDFKDFIRITFGIGIFVLLAIFLNLALLFL
jgi:hypothetical protein